MSFPLSDERLRELYKSFTPDAEWCASITSAIRWFRDLSPEQKRSEENQRRLWRMNEVGGVGPGSGVPVEPAFNDPEVVERLLALPSLVAEVSRGRRPEFMQGEYDAILNRVFALSDDARRPMALLSRVFVVLLPEYTHTVFSYRVNLELVRRLLHDRPSEHLTLRVAVRSRLREALGDEQDLAEHVRRITFCWWLATQTRADLVSGSISSAASPRAVESDAAEPLVLWPFTKQLKGWVSVPGYAETYRQVVRETAGGADADEVVAALDEALGWKSPAKRFRNLVSRVRRLGFIERRDGALWPTDEGEELVEDDPPDVLVEKLLVQTYGMAQFLSHTLAEPQHTSVVYDALAQEYPNWTTPTMPSHLRSWLKALGLITVNEASVALTEYGRLWKARLPESLPHPPEGFFDAEVDEALEEAMPNSARPGVEPTVQELRAGMLADEAMATFVLDDGQLAALHAAWHGNPTKRFAIFSGLSGTGKTALMRQYAHTYCKLAGVAAQDHIALVAVSPDWRDPTGLLGYFNALHADPTYQAQPATRLLVRAARNPELPYFLLLDEMNLARVERYLAPLLSAMETNDPIELHAHDEPVNGVPPRVRWPARLFIGGTVNMDESTHSFSDKVLDRAFTLESWDVDLRAYFDRRAAAGHARQETVEAALKQLHDSLVTCRRHFGYRTADEVLRFVERASVDNMLSATEALDAAIFSRVLPRLRGTDLDGLDRILPEVQQVLDAYALQRSAAKVASMAATLSRTGVTRFFA